MEFNNKPNELVTTTDGCQLWRSRSVAVTSTVIIQAPGRDKYVLLVHRHPKSTKPNLWCLPCGFLDWNETGGDAALRETWEESGLNLCELRKRCFTLYGGIFNNKPWHVSTDIDTDRQNVVLHFASVFETTKLPELSLANTEPDELIDAQWVPLKQALKHQSMAFKHDRRIQQFLDFSRGMF